MASWTQDTVIESPPEHSNIISPRDEYEVSHRLQTLEEKIGNILKKACQQKEVPIQEDDRAPYPEKDDSDSSTEMLKLLQSMETKLNCIETCLEKDKGRLLTTTPEQNEGVSDKFLYSVLGNVTDPGVTPQHLLSWAEQDVPLKQGLKQLDIESEIKESRLPARNTISTDL
ncbi:hypothetical protein AOXY_G2958 [Acipenser oxyrinchus oxyrinchus]|uniref:Uncharacterized protein n=1 Tax=Acipenser oxyrinchus oxyrinchus TaxID=40147 RepID=A0AAD8GIV8_ACIOX|nr:hypothetical protein AOXY_G2958 [Acipenser oxyrinchus oxyrinchus]